MEKPGRLLGADSSSEQLLQEGKEGVERGTMSLQGVGGHGPCVAAQEG